MVLENGESDLRDGRVLIADRGAQRNPTDHTEVDELKEVLGITE